MLIKGTEDMEMTLLYIVSIPKQDEYGEYSEDHYFKSSYKATIFAINCGIERFNAMKFDSSLADQLAED